MNNRWFCKRQPHGRQNRLFRTLPILAVWLLLPASGLAGDAPGWLHALASTPLPKYADDTKVVRLLDEKIVTVKDNGEIKTLHRRAYRILRPQGRDYGLVPIPFDSETRISNLKAWCIPAQGKDYEVKEKDAVESSAFDGELYSDDRVKILRIPAADPGNVIGYEYEQKERPYILQNTWWFQEDHPVRQARLILQLPAGWEYKAYWLNYAEQKPATGASNEWRWELTDIPALKQEPLMPPPQAVKGRLLVVYYPSGDRQKAIASWNDLAKFYYGLTVGRREATPEIKQKVAELTAGAKTTLDKMRALGAFVQRDVRYVAIEIGIGGLQPHAAQDVFSKRYGDCKDKATLLSTMLRQAGIESYYVLIHNRRGVNSPQSPAALSFNHAILAIRIPDGVPTANLYAVRNDPKLGQLLFFDPTSRLTPLGYLPATLQANYGLVVTDQGGELVQLPLLPPTTNRLTRVAKLSLSSTGTLSGEVQEVRWGEPAVSRRGEFLEATGSERVKVLEGFLANFLGGFKLTRAEVDNLEKFDENLVLRYHFVAENYAKTAGDLLLVRPRVLGRKSTDLLERKERIYPVEFDTASLETDTFEIALPSGYVVDELPPPVEADYGFASYHSQVQVSNGLLRYERTYQIKDVLVPTQQLAELKKFHQRVAADEFTSAVLARSAH